MVVVSVVVLARGLGHWKIFEPGNLMEPEPPEPMEIMGAKS